MKKIICNNELLEKIEEAVNLLGNAVSSSLGPKGRNVLINSPVEVPYITNDGVTIAKNIESEDEVVDTILSILKEASLKTDELVGDGTTSTIVFLKSLILQGIKLIREGVNPVNLQKELESSLEEAKTILASLKKEPQKEDYQKIAINSANSKHLGTITSEVFQKVENYYGIKVKESNNSETYVKYIEGYQLDSGLVSPYLLGINSHYTFSNSSILILDMDLDNLSFLEDTINNILIENGTLTILANSFDENVINEITQINELNKAKIILINNPDYAIRRKEILEDLKNLTKSEIISKEEEYTVDKLGKIENISGDYEKTIISCSSPPQKRINEIKKEILHTDDLYQLEYLNERLAKLQNLEAIIYVGGFTKTEAKEKMMRVTDALWALKSAKEGICVGEGITFLKVSDKLSSNTFGEKILKKCLKMPFLQIMKNLGLEPEEMLKKVAKDNYNYIYNIEKDKIESILTTKVFDSYKVLQKSLETAVSIAGIILTTSYLIINEAKI